MADYYPLLARALDALPDRSPALRKAVYERARNALISQLRSLDPPLSEGDIDLERQALDKAIARLEVDHGGVSAPANDVPPPPVVVPIPPIAERPPAPDVPPAGPPVQASFPPEPVSPPPAPVPAPPAVASPPPTLPAASAPSFAPIPVPVPEPRESPIPIASRKARQAEVDLGPGLATPEARPEPGSAAGPASSSAIEPSAANGRQRPRIAVVLPRAGRSRALRNAVVGLVLALAIGSIAVAAFLLRDKPQTLQAAGTEASDPQQSDGEAKFGDRVGGEAAQTDRTVPRQNGAAQRLPAPARSDGAPGQPGVSVAQRAVLIQESAGGESAPPTSSPGRVTWRLEPVDGEQGQPLQNAVVATVTFPDPGLTLVMTIQRNLDATLPASHTVSLAFSGTGADAASRAVQDVGLLQAKDDEAGRGSPVSGLPVRVRENLFLIGLSSLRNDVERNTDLLLRRNWFDLAVRYTSGKRAVLTFEKGTNGTQVLQGAFDGWK